MQISTIRTNTTEAETIREKSNFCSGSKEGSTSGRTGSNGGSGITIGSGSGCSIGLSSSSLEAELLTGSTISS